LSKRLEATRIDNENKVLREKILYAQPTIKADLKPINLTAGKTTSLVTSILEKKKNTLQKTKS